tara:strand:+ start:476 stop:862 length:387 start_codon:yes stop_codon:yes gene_type:complete
MAISKAKFKSLAAKLIKVSSGDIKGVAAFHFNSGDWNYKTQTSTSTTEQADAVVTSFEGKDFVSELKGVSKIKATSLEMGDVKMFVVFDDLTQDPQFSTLVEFNGVKYTVINRMVDGAEAAYILQLRS